MKPAWSTAPEWAQFLTHDSIGWRWWENKPMLYPTGMYWVYPSRVQTVNFNALSTHLEARDGTTNTQCPSTQPGGV